MQVLRPRAKDSDGYQGEVEDVEEGERDESLLGVQNVGRVAQDVGGERDERDDERSARPANKLPRFTKKSYFDHLNKRTSLTGIDKKLNLKIFPFL